MKVLIIMMILWAYNVVLIAVFFNIALEKRTSTRGMILGSMGFYVAQCALRIPTFLCTGLKYLLVLNVVCQIVFFTYQFLVFRATLQKRILVNVLVMGFMSMIEIATSWLGYVLMGEYEALNFQSEGYALQCLLNFPMMTISIYPFMKIWGMFQKIEWNQDKRIWLCLAFPISQYLISEFLIENYGKAGEAASVLVILGVVLGCVGDFYMFTLFYKENQRIKAEIKLRQEQELYRKEQAYYENLKENQKESAHIRHDYQNYMLLVKNLLENGQGGEL